MMNKKGAIEFSMTTIMVVIIGVAVLALGLTWIRTTFEQVGTITEGSLEAAETIVGEVAFSGKASAPATITMKANDAKKFKILVKNIDMSPHEYKLDIADPDPNTCFSHVNPPDVGIPLEAGKVGEFVGGVFSKDICSNTDTAILVMTIKQKKIGSADWSYASDYSTEAIVLQIA